MAYEIQKDAKGNIISLKLKNPAIGNISAKTQSIPIPEQGEAFLFGGTNEQRNQMNIGILQGNKIITIELPSNSGFGNLAQSGAGSQLFQQLGININDVRTFTTDILSQGTGFTKDVRSGSRLGDFDTAELRREAATSQLTQEVSKIVSEAKDFGVKVGSGSTNVISTGGDGSNLGLTSAQVLKIEQDAGRVSTPPEGAGRTTAGQYEEGKAYKNPNNAEIFLYKDGKMNWIKDQAAWEKTFPGTKPEEGTNYTTLDTVQGLQFGPTISGDRTGTTTTSSTETTVGATPTTPTTPTTTTPTTPTTPTGATPTGTGDSDIMTTDQKALIDDLNSQINAMDLTIEQKAILKEIAAGDYTSGAHIPTQQELSQIIQDAATNAEVDLSPYYEKLTGRTIEDLKTDMANIRGEAERFEKAEVLDYKQKLAQTKQSLRTRGLTFSGISRRQLGAEGALEARGVEGELPTARKLGYEEQIADYQQRAGVFGTKAERELGSEAITGLSTSTFGTPYGTRQLYKPRGTTTVGDIQLERLAEIEKSKWDRVSAYKSYI